MQTDKISSFVVAFELYKKTKEITSFENEGKINLFANFENGLEVRSRLLRVADLRKFVLSKSDPLYLLKVHDAVAELGRVSIDQNSRRTLENLLSILQDGNVGPIAIHESNDGVQTPDSQIVRDALYGVMLHGDSSKLKLHMARSSTSVNLAIFSWLSIAEGICMVMEKLCRETIKLTPGASPSEFV